MKIIFDTDKKTFSGYIDDCWKYVMEHSDTQLKTAKRPKRYGSGNGTAE